MFHLCVNIWWLRVDNHAIETDEEGHMISSRQYYTALFPFEEPRDIKSRLIALSRIELGIPAHPPLLHILTAVTIRILGYSTNTMAFTITPLFLLSLLGCYLIARLYLTDWEALFTVSVVSFTPIMYAASRYLMTDYLSMALAVWAMYALLRSQHFTRTRWALLFGVLNGLGVLARPTTAVYLLAPAAAAGCAGLLFALLKREERSLRLYRLFRNTILTLLVSLILFAPWYAWHYESFFGYWLNRHEGGPLAVLRYVETEQGDSTSGTTPQQPTSQKSSNSTKAPTAATPIAPTAPSSIWRINWNPNIPWIRYPVFIINNGVFLTSFILFVIGICLLPCFGRFRRSWALWQLVIWAIGSYLLMTTLMSFATARYALQFIPPIAMLSAIPFLLIKRIRIRRCAQTLYIALLLFQFGNLSIHDYGAWARLKAPLMPDARMQREYDDHGLYIFKPMLTLSFSYSRISAPMKDNFKDRLFWAMMRTEQEHSYTGTEAPYARLNIRGMILDEQHYWPDLADRPNPFRRNDIPAEYMPRRRFRHYGWSKKIDDIISALGTVQYVAYTTEWISEEEETQWLSILEAHGFELVDRFHEERYGRVPARYYGLVARPPVWQPINIANRADILAANLDDLYRFRYSDAFETLAPALQELTSTRINQLFEQAGRPSAIYPGLKFVAMDIKHTHKYSFNVNMLFQASERIPCDAVVFLRGLVDPDHRGALPPELRRTGHIDWHFDPVPNTHFWPFRKNVLVRSRISAPLIPIRLHVGIYHRQDGILGDVIDYGVVDFKALANTTSLKQQE